MAALRDQWEAARKARQQEILQRREAVLEELAYCQQIREADAATVRTSLADYYASVRDETNLYLAQIEQQRRAMAKRTAEQLRAFDAELREAVAELRTANQAECIDRQLATQKVLAGHHRDRAVMHSRQQQVLSDYVNELQMVVADYLTEIAENRQAMAVVDQAQRHRDREIPTQAVQTLRDDFAIHLQQIRDFRENLRQSVWGDAVSDAAPAATPTKAPTTPRKAPSRQPRAKAKAAPTTHKTKTATTDDTKASAPAAPKSAPAKSTIPTEEAVFDYLQAHNDGARLTEIESTLGINRFQAVDALRSLIQKELIVQKDRTYRIQEEAVL